MSHEISRLYATAEAAANAAAELREEGFTDIFIVNPPTAADVPVSAIAAQIAQGHVLLADARVYAAGVAAGGSLLTVHAPFASGKLATVILESHKPIASGKVEPAPEKLWDEAAPLSSALMMPLLLDDPTPASHIAGVPALTSDDCSFSGAIGLPLLKSSDMPDTKWGLKLLSDNPAPLSSLLGLPLLTGPRRRG